MFKIFILGQDITPFVIDEIARITSSSEFPYFADTQAGRVSFTLFSLNDKFDPLKSDNFFTKNDHHQSGYKAIVEISHNSGYDPTMPDGSLMFIGTSLTSFRTQITTPHVSPSTTSLLNPVNPN